MTDQYAKYQTEEFHNKHAILTLINEPTGADHMTYEDIGRLYVTYYRPMEDTRKVANIFKWIEQGIKDGVVKVDKEGKAVWIKE